MRGNCRKRKEEFEMKWEENVINTKHKFSKGNSYTKEILEVLIDNMIRKDMINHMSKVQLNLSPIKRRQNSALYLSWFIKFQKQMNSLKNSNTQSDQFVIPWPDNHLFLMFCSVSKFFPIIGITITKSFNFFQSLTRISNSN